MKQILKQLAQRVTASLNRLGEDFNMVLINEGMAFYADMAGFEQLDEELFV